MAGREGSSFIGEGTMLEKLEHYIVQERVTNHQVPKEVTSQRARRAVIPVTSMPQPAHISKEHDNRTGTLTSLPRSTVIPSSKFNVTDVTLSDSSSGSKSFKYRFLDDCASGIPRVANSTQMILGSLYDGHTATPALMPASAFTKASGLEVCKTSITADCMSPKLRMILPPASSTGHDGSLNQDLASLQTNQERDLTIPRIPPATCPVTDVRRAASSAAHPASYPSSGCRSIKRPNEDNRSSTVYPRHSRRHASIEYSRNSTSQIASANDISIHFPSKKTNSAHLGAVQPKQSKKSNCTKVNALLSLGNVNILQTRHLLNNVAPITQKCHMLRESIPTDKIATPSAKVYLSKKEAVTPSALRRTTRSDGSTRYKRTFQHRGQRLKISSKDQHIIAKRRELGSSWAVSEPAEPSGDITGGTREAITVGIFQSTEPDIEKQDVEQMDYQGTRRRALPKVVLHHLKFRISEVNGNGTQIDSNTLDTDSSIGKFPSKLNDDSGELLTPELISESDRSNCQRNLISGYSNDSEHHSDSSEATISADEIEPDNLSSKGEKINHSTDQDTDQQPFNPPLSPPNSVGYGCNVDLNDDCSSQSYPECLRIDNDFSEEKSGSFETTGSGDNPWTDHPTRSISDFSKDNCPPPSDPEVRNDLDRQLPIQQNSNCIDTLEEAWSGSFGIRDDLIASEPEHPCYEGHSDPVGSYSDEVESNTISYSSTSDSGTAVAISRATCSLHEVVSDISTDIEDNRDVLVVGAECDTSSGGEKAGSGNMSPDKSTIFGDVSHTEGIDLPADLSLLRGTDKLRVLRERMLRREKEINQLVNNHQQME